MKREQPRGAEDLRDAMTARNLERNVTLGKNKTEKTAAAVK